MSNPYIALSEYELRYLPTHLGEAEQWDQLESLLTDIFFLEAKNEAGIAFVLASDFAAAIKALPNTRPRHRLLELLEEALRRDIHFIDRHRTDYPQALFQCLWNSCWWYDCPGTADYNEPAREIRLQSKPRPEREEPSLCRLLEEWRGAKTTATPHFRWVRSLRPPPVPLASGLRAVFDGHTSALLGAAISADGSMIASGSQDGTSRVWSVDTGRELLRLTAHARGAIPLGFTPDSGRLVTAGMDNIVRVWDTQNGEELQQHTGRFGGGLHGVALSPDGECIVSTWDGGVGIWSLRTGKTLLHIPLDVEVHSVAFSPDGRRIAAGAGFEGADHLRYAVLVWDSTTGRELQRFRGHFAHVFCIAFSPDGTRLASGGLDMSVRVWNLGSGREERCIELPTGGPSPMDGAALDVGFSWSGTRLAVGCGDRSVRVWNLHSGAEESVFPRELDKVVRVLFSPADRYLLSAGGLALRLWNPDRADFTRVSTGHSRTIRSVSFLGDGERIVTTGEDATVRIWDTASGRQQRVIPVEGRGWCLAGSPNGDLLCGSGNTSGNAVCLWSSRTGAQLRVWRPEGEVWNLAFSVDGRRIGCLGSQGAAVYRIGQDRPLCEFWYGGEESWCQSLVFSPNIALLASSGSPSTGASEKIRIQKLSGKSKSLSLDAGGRTNWLRFSEDGKFLYTLTEDNWLRAWEIRSRRDCIRLRPKSKVLRAYLSGVHQRLAFATEDGQVELWSLTEGSRIGVFEGDWNLRSLTEGRLTTIQRKVETAIGSPHSGRPVAWVNAIFNRLATHRGESVWALAHREHLHLFTLEGA